MKSTAHDYDKKVRATPEDIKNTESGLSFSNELLWRDISTAPKDGTKIIGWMVPNEVDAPKKAKPRVISWQVKQWKDGTGKKIGKPFGLWESDESCGAMSYAPTHWIPKP